VPAVLSGPFWACLSDWFIHPNNSETLGSSGAANGSLFCVLFTVCAADFVFHDNAARFYLGLFVRAFPALG
jgi:hypothetical protein